MLTHPALLVTIAIIPAVAILAYYLHVVRFAPEPWPRVLGCVAAGGLAFLVAGWLQPELARWVPRTQPWAWALGVVAPSEELLKLVAILLVAPSPLRYERISSGLMYGVAAGVGFACIENVFYVREFGAVTALVRAVTAVPSHALHSALVGLGLGVGHRILGASRRISIVAVAVFAAVLLHGLYDGLLLSGGRARGVVVVVLMAEALMVRFLVKQILEWDLRQDMDALARVPLLVDVPVAALRLLASGATRQRIRPGTAVIKQGRAGEALFLILRGALDVFVDGEKVRTMGQDDFFGERSVLTGGLRSADVVCSAEALLLRVPRELLMRAVHGNAELAAVLTSRGNERFGAGVLPSAEALVAAAARAVTADRAEGLAARLGEVDMFSDLLAEDLEAVARACVRVHRGPAGKLVRAGRRGPGLCLILSGQARVRLSDRSVDLVEGDVFGEINLLTDWPATATVISETPIELAVLRWVDLDRVVARNPELGWRLLETLHQRAARDIGVSRAAEPRASRRMLSLAWRGLRGASSDGEGSKMRSAFPELATLSDATAETIESMAEAVAGPGASGEDLYLSAAGALSGPFGDFGPASDGRAQAQWWRLPRGELFDGVARCPDVLRFLSRLLILAHRRR